MGVWIHFKGCIWIITFAWHWSLHQESASGSSMLKAHFRCILQAYRLHGKLSWRAMERLWRRKAMRAHRAVLCGTTGSWTVCDCIPWFSAGILSNSCQISYSRTPSKHTFAVLVLKHLFRVNYPGPASFSTYCSMLFCPMALVKA